MKEKSKREDSQASSLANVSSRRSFQDPNVVQLPQATVSLIHGNIIDLSAASRFYKQRAKVATLLEDFVQPLPDSHYRLRGQFDSYYFGNLHFFLSGTPVKVADSMAEALFYLGRQWARTDYGRLPIAAIPSDEFLRNVWHGASDWEAFLSRDGCIGEVWRFALADDGSVHSWSGGSDPNDFELRLEYGWDTTQPPTMTIRLKGAPTAILMNWWMTLSPNSPPEQHPAIKELREKTGTILDSVVQALKAKLKLTRAEKGRPREGFGEQAAYLLDHKGESIGLIAKKLCQLPQTATPSARRQCFDRIRKAANNYYKLLGKDYKGLTSIRVRERIIRVPGNVSPVKSE